MVVQKKFPTVLKAGIILGEGGQARVTVAKASLGLLHARPSAACQAASGGPGDRRQIARRASWSATVTARLRPPAEVEKAAG